MVTKLLLKPLVRTKCMDKTNIAEGLRCECTGGPKVSSKADSVLANVVTADHCHEKERRDQGNEHARKLGVLDESNNVCCDTKRETGQGNADFLACSTFNS